nr:immunoglobulin heavy chain junction region [Macaca mulatta]MOW22481.1 immunoglobulin heavy chain junction region [Macaca mulatta]
CAKINYGSAYAPYYFFDLW